MNIFNLLFRETFWVSYYRKESTNIRGISNNNNPWHRVTVESGRYWCADPFIVEDGGLKYIFCELMDRKTSRGLLGYGLLQEEGDTKIHVLMDVGCHTSYPNVFKYEGVWYLIPETSARKTVELYKADSFPDKWTKIGDLITGRHAVDTTIFMQSSIPYVFIYEPGSKGNKLSIAEIDFPNCRLINERLLKDYSRKIGRPGGNIITEDGNYYRVTQSGEKIYGEKLVFMKFLLGSDYSEEDVVELKPLDFHVNGDIVFEGTHTYNRGGGYEIADFRYKKRMIKRPLEVLCKSLQLFGYKFEK